MKRKEAWPAPPPPRATSGGAEFSELRAQRGEPSPARVWGRGEVFSGARAASPAAVGCVPHRIPVPGPNPGSRARAAALDRPALRTPPARGPRTPGLRRTEPGLNRGCRGPFRSPRPSPKSGQSDGTSEQFLNIDIQKLKDKKDMLDKEIYQLMSEGCSVDELDDHISQLHEYNDIKDVGQMLLGQLAMIRGVTTKELYPEFDLDMND
ncbi:DNA repair protein SWI5 homolog [Perognathus longimembris pacificus]|uniref:DNA repair protein SWI5 homolog n=1 Tax=Perognathus longimembris pacificus TaxID=214514 RepID=UPI0020194919|nr:DNA repair protein SWI5 homolog [Perognathus longimembris pacificus]